MSEYLTQSTTYLITLAALSLVIVVCWKSIHFALAKTWFLLLLIIWCMLVMGFFQGYCEFAATAGITFSERHYCQMDFFKTDSNAASIFIIVAILAMLQHREYKIKALSEKIEQLKQQLSRENQS